MGNDRHIAREECLKIFEAYKFKRTKPQEKSDEYKNAHSHITLYFFWKQGLQSELDIAINPELGYQPLLKLPNISLKFTPEGEGIRFGTSMSEFPKQYKNHTPGNPQSRVGRIFRIQLLAGDIDRFQPLRQLLAALTGMLKEYLISAEEPTGEDSISFESDMASENEPFPGTGANSIRQPMSVEEFQAQLDRRSEIGEAGELIALKFERQRVGAAEVGCPDPEYYVKHIAPTDVGRGYDIETIWPGHERCIEVKSSTSFGNDIFMSDNEKRVLTELGDRAWLYRVVVDANGDGEVALRLNDPISKIPTGNISAAVWRVCLPKSDE